MPEELGIATEAVEAPPIESTETVETATDESLGTPEETQETVETPEAEGEQKPVEQSQVLSHLDELKKTNPALAKELKNLYFAQKAFKETFPGGLPEAKKALETIGELGGAEGIEGLKAEKAEWHEIDDKFAAGDPAVLDTFAKFNPEGFAKIIPAAIDKLAQIDPAAYNHALSGIFVSTLDNWRFADTLDRLAEDLSQVVGQDGKPLLGRQIQSVQKLAAQYEGIRELAAKAPERKAPEGKGELDTERAKVAQERTELNTQYVSQQTETYAQKSYNAAIPAEAKNQGLNLDTLKSAGAYERFMGEIDEEIGREIAKDKDAISKIGSSIATGRRDEAVRLSNAKFDAVKGQAIKKVVQRWARLTNPKGVAKKADASATKPNPAGVKKIEGPPNTDLVDQTDPNWRQNYMMHSKAKLKTGQVVTW
jgi:hypothetical protein